MEDQPLPVDASPTALSPGYVVDSDLEKDEKDPKWILLTIMPIEEIMMMMSHLMMMMMMLMMLRRTRRTRRRRSTWLWPTLLMYLQIILSPQAENTEAFETDESASTPSTIFTTTT
nr:hypothetical protein [Tanacetum cinerariifolium]